MKQIPSIKAVMTPFPYSIGVEERVDKARELMDAHGIRHLPVIDGKRLVGILAERDVERSEDARVGPTPEQQPRVGDLCRMQTYVVGLNEPLDVVLDGMVERHAEAAIVIREEKLVGIFTMSDACRQFLKLLRSLFPRSGSDSVA